MGHCAAFLCDAVRKMCRPGCGKRVGGAYIRHAQPGFAVRLRIARYKFRDAGCQGLFHNKLAVSYDVYAGSEMLQCLRHLYSLSHPYALNAEHVDCFVPHACDF